MMEDVAAAMSVTEMKANGLPEHTHDEVAVLVEVASDQQKRRYSYQYNANEAVENDVQR
jgi:hypothetical protein